MRTTKTLRNILFVGALSLFSNCSLYPTQTIFSIEDGHFTATKLPNKLLIKYHGGDPGIKDMHDFNPRNFKLDSMSNGLNHLVATDNYNQKIYSNLWKNYLNSEMKR